MSEAILLDTRACIAYSYFNSVSFYCLNINFIDLLYVFKFAVLYIIKR